MQTGVYPTESNHLVLGEKAGQQQDCPLYPNALLLCQDSWPFFFLLHPELFALKVTQGQHELKHLRLVNPVNIPCDPSLG